MSSTYTSCVKLNVVVNNKYSDDVMFFVLVLRGAQAASETCVFYANGVQNVTSPSQAINDTQLLPFRVKALAFHRLTFVPRPDGKRTSYSVRLSAKGVRSHLHAFLVSQAGPRAGNVHTRASSAL